MQYQKTIALCLCVTGLLQTGSCHRHYSCNGTMIGNVIVNGHRARDDALQYMASVQTAGGHLCGGFLVSDDFVLTAAHCSDNMHLVRVVLGNHDLKNPRNAQTIEITKTIRHPAYKSVGTGNDLMLLKLKKKAVMAYGVKIIQLADPTMNIQARDRCQVAGWGKTQTHGGSVNNLMVTDVPIIDLPTCKSAWNGLPPNVICAGGYTTDHGFCQGDSGGPLVCKNTAVGIVSFNYKGLCHYENGKPNVFVDISKYIDWILNTISLNQHTTSKARL